MTKASPDLTSADLSADPDPAAPSWLPIGVLLAGSGVLHLVSPKPYEYLIPKALGDPKPWVLWSGVLELGVAAGLAVPRTRRVAGLAAAALFVGVFPGNLEMARKVVLSERSSALWKAGNLARLPLQIPMVTRSLRIARAAKR